MRMWKTLVLCLVGCGGNATPPDPPQRSWVIVVVDAPHSKDAGAESDAGLRESPPPCGERLFNGSCRWEDGRCFSYYGWETEAIQTRTCSEPTAVWGDEPCQQEASCLSRVNFDDSCTVVCNSP